MGPPNGAAGFGQVCGFVAALAEGGAAVECTCVEHPDVDVAATRRLALALQHGQSAPLAVPSSPPVPP